MTADKEYVDWLTDLKRRYKQSQLRTAVKANSEVLEYYWNLGRDIVAKEAESKWGSGFFNQLSLDMRAMFPDEKGFSSANLRYMKRWYEFYYQRIVNLQQPVEEIEKVNLQHLQQPVEDLKMPDAFGFIPWGHHIYIFTKSQSLDEALFYIRKVATEGWNRTLLEHHVTAHLFQSQGSAITNFEATLPSAQIEEATQLLKKEYDLSFITVEEVKKEKDLENALAKNITEFLLELGRGFSYVGRQMELQMPGGQTYFPDLVFYHIPQHRYVVVELKAVKFIPEFAGKLNFYVTAADKLLRGKGDNPSVGLLICKSTDKTIVEWSLQDIQKPLGVASYQLQEVVERTIAELENLKKHGDEEI
ncbi:MAG: PDDEXK nuclease domain-containing protein [Paludibacteraceae bacterium]|nr:PDDEXK nuclease domain-containing protein [Paludibacteraceae bacterium]